MLKPLKPTTPMSRVSSSVLARGVSRSAFPNAVADEVPNQLVCSLSLVSSLPQVIKWKEGLSSCLTACKTSGRSGLNLGARSPTTFANRDSSTMLSEQCAVCSCKYGCWKEQGQLFTSSLWPDLPQWPGKRWGQFCTPLRHQYVSPQQPRLGMSAWPGP